MSIAGEGRLHTVQFTTRKSIDNAERALGGVALCVARLADFFLSGMVCYAKIPTS